MTIIQSQWLPIWPLSTQLLISIARALDIEELGVREPAQLARPAVHRYPDVDNVEDVVKKGVQVSRRHFWGDAANIDGAARWVVGLAEFHVGGICTGEGDEDGASFEVRAIYLVDCESSGFGGIKGYVSESRTTALVHI